MITKLFMNLERVSLADVDTDYAPKDREIIKEYLFNKEGLYCSEIITFNTIALKGAVRDVCRALYKKDITEELNKKADKEVIGYGKLTDNTSKEIKEYSEGEYLKISNYICENIEVDENQMRKEYPKVFEYVDILQGVIVSVGSHPCGFIVSPIPLDENIGTFTTTTSKYPISQINMKEIDSLNFVKLDILGLDNIQVINEVCELANINRLTPDNIDDTDENVWNSILENNLGIFQWESSFAHDYYKKLFSKSTIEKIKSKNPNFSYIDLFSIGNGAIRPAGESYRESLANGEFKDNGHEALNQFLAPTLGYLVYQEQIIEFLHTFCGYTMGQADIVRRSFSKKLGTDEHIPKIKDGFIKTMKEKYNIEKEESEKIIISFLKVIEDASDYLFSENHAKPYSYIGYACAWLRYYYPLEFLTVCSNIWADDEAKTKKIIEYAKELKINIVSPKFKYSKSGYSYDKNTNSIYKGMYSIKYLNEQVAEELYSLRDNNYNNFIELLRDIYEKTSCNSRQLDILIKLNFFKEFGNNANLLKQVEIFNQFFNKKQIKKDKVAELNLNKDIIERNSTPTEKTYTKINSEQIIKELAINIPNKSIPLRDQIQAEVEYYGYATTTIEKSPTSVSIVLNIDTKYTPKVTLYNLKTGENLIVKCTKTDMKKNIFNDFSIIKVNKLVERNKKKKVDNEWVISEEKELYLKEWELLK